MRKIDKYGRLLAAADVMCRGEEETLERTKANLAHAREQADRLLAMGSEPNGVAALLPEMCCARLSRTFAEIARLEEEMREQARAVHLARLRRDKAGEMVRGERSRLRLEKQAKDVETHLEIVSHANRARPR